MIDFSKQLDKGAIVAKIDPIDIYIIVWTDTVLRQAPFVMLRYRC